MLKNFIYIVFLIFSNANQGIAQNNYTFIIQVQSGQTLEQKTQKQIIVWLSDDNDEVNATKLIATKAEYQKVPSTSFQTVVNRTVQTTLNKWIGCGMVTGGLIAVCTTVSPTTTIFLLAYGGLTGLTVCQIKELQYRNEDELLMDTIDKVDLNPLNQYRIEYVDESFDAITYIETVNKRLKDMRSRQ